MPKYVPKLVARYPKQNLSSNLTEHIPPAEAAASQTEGAATVIQTPPTKSERASCQN